MDSMPNPHDEDLPSTLQPPYGGAQLLRDPLYNKGAAFSPRNAKSSICTA